MAIEKTVESVGMKITVNHGEVGGKIVKASKTYGDVKEGVTTPPLWPPPKPSPACRSPSGKNR